MCPAQLSSPRVLTILAVGFGCQHFTIGRRSGRFSRKYLPLYFTVLMWLSAWAVNEVRYWEHPCHYRSWNCLWNPEECFDRLTLWCPPPKLAPQSVYFLLQCYVERPATTSMLVVLPRTLQRKWTKASCHVVEIGVYQRGTVPFVNQSFLTIPIILLLLPFHVRTLPADRLDQVAPTPLRLFHRQQATLVRGLLETLDAY
jgi:hypothetical protein